MKQKSLLYSAALLTAIAGPAAHASVVGVFHENLVNGNNTVFVFGNEGTTGTIVGGGGLNDTFSIDSSGVFEFSLGSSGREMSTSGAVNMLSFKVTSDDEDNNPISALALNRGGASTDMTTLLDVDGLGSEYVVLTTPGRFGDGSQMSVTAIKDNTVVTINPVNIDGATNGVPQTVTLQAGESVFYESTTNGGGGLSDLSGTTVSASEAVAVFAGAECTQVPNGVEACDHLISQQFSVDNFDTKFRVADNFGGGADGDLIRVIASEDNTQVFFNDTLQRTINAGEVLEIDNVTEGELTSSKPVQVGQFVRGQGGTRTTGDPAFAILPSVDQELDGYAYSTPVGFDSFQQNFLNIAIEDSIAGSLTLNGSSVDTSAFDFLDGILYGNVAISAGSGVIEASDSFLATISGFSNFDSYFTPIATAFSPGVSPPPDPDPDPNPDPSVIPLPAGGWLMLGGLALLGGMRKRRKAA